ncbi:MAG TPA: hypothetical protein VFE76_07850, partial [Myxococcales bacterium]|nr:hypothetical protein [Myxococcales bacterium]
DELGDGARLVALRLVIAAKLERHGPLSLTGEKSACSGEGRLPARDPGARMEIEIDLSRWWILPPPSGSR